MPTALSRDAEKIALEFKEFAYIVSHDLNAPARAMVEFSKLLLAENGDALSDEARQYLNLIVDSGRELQEMLNGLLDYSRINTAGKPREQIGPEDIHAVFDHCRIAFADRIAALGATIEIGPMPGLFVDFDQFGQLIRVLFDNALRYGRPGVAPHIAVSAEPHLHWTEITVRDNGIGIAPQYHARIFEPFKRLHPREQHPGAGMGLAVAKKIVERHGGKISVKNCDDHGVMFIFTVSRA